MNPKSKALFLSPPLRELHKDDPLKKIEAIVIVKSQQDFGQLLKIEKSMGLKGSRDTNLSPGTLQFVTL